MTKEDAAKKVQAKLGEAFGKVTFYKQTPEAFIFVAETKEKEAVPNKLITAVNKNNGQLGFSVYSVEMALDGCRKA